MTIPVTYNLRSLAVRKTTTVMTVAGIALSVAVLMAVLALVNGLRTALRTTGSPLNVLVLRKGATSETSSSLSRTVFQDLKFTPGIARDNAGEPMASLEIVRIVDLAKAGAAGRSNITLRGLLPAGIALRPGIRLLNGRWFQAGRREVVAGKSIAARHPELNFGNRIRIASGYWDVVGVMECGDSAVNSELFSDLNQVSAEFHRLDLQSSILLRAADESSVPTLIEAIESDRRLNVLAGRESDYYAAQTSSGAPIAYIGIFVSLVMAGGSIFAAMNTMYAAVSRRSREIGTLRVLGFTQWSILLCFLAESLLLSLAGGVVGCVIVLPLNWIQTEIMSFTTFTDVAFSFRVSAATMASGIGFALFIGGAGGFLPARVAARSEILSCLRES